MTVRLAPPDGTRFVLPDEAQMRARMTEVLQRLYDSWGYERVDPPVLERYDATHPRAAQSFKLSDADNEVLALRSDFTPAIAQLVRAQYGDLERPLRFQYSGKLWQAINPDIARIREFTQIGLELVGISNARADAELIHLARESVRTVGLTPRVEVGNPGFVRALFELAAIPADAQDAVADAIDRKDQTTLAELLSAYRLAPDLRRALLEVADLYGAVEVLTIARALAPWPESLREIERLQQVIAEFEDSSELLIDLGMARRHSYYTGITFRAYTFDFGQPLLGGGRYDGALLPYAAGFAIGLERLLGALPRMPKRERPLVVSLDDRAARVLRKAGYAVERALSDRADEVRQYAKRYGVPYVLTQDGLESSSDTPPPDELLSVIGGSHGG
jgi:ATP phosphoribosyltransferase regulatory subunit